MFASSGDSISSFYDYVHLKVSGQADGTEMYFRMKRTAQLKKLINLYCASQNLNPDFYRFFLYGRRIKGHQTPLELGMEDGDEIDAMLCMMGGGATV